MTTPEPLAVSSAVSSNHSHRSAFWYRRLFAIVAGICTSFLVLTTVAMFLYPGGAPPVASTHGYQFFINFLSDLGQTRTQSGAANYPSMLLFTAAMLAAGTGLGVFFIAFARWFADRSTSKWATRFAWAAAAVGLVAAVCFVGIGVTPYNLFYDVHEIFAQWAFRFLLAAMILEIPAIRLSRGVSNSMLWINVSFVVLLFGYILMVMFGPTTGTLVGEEIHVVGQKLIAYTAITSLFMQALLVRSHMRWPAVAYAEAVK
jgi:hypothetical protein